MAKVTLQNLIDHKIVKAVHKSADQKVTYVPADGYLIKDSWNDCVAAIVHDEKFGKVMVDDGIDSVCTHNANDPIELSIFSITPVELIDIANDSCENCGELLDNCVCWLRRKSSKCD